MRGWFPTVSLAVSNTPEGFPFSRVGNPAWKHGNFRHNPASTVGFGGFHPWKRFGAWKPKVSIGFLGGFHPEGSQR